jgi:hypothetical protein
MLTATGALVASAQQPNGLFAVERSCPAPRSRNVSESQVERQAVRTYSLPFRFPLVGSTLLQAIQGSWMAASLTAHWTVEITQQLVHQRGALKRISVMDATDCTTFSSAVSTMSRITFLISANSTITIPLTKSIEGEIYDA